MMKWPLKHVNSGNAPFCELHMLNVMLLTSLHVLEFWLHQPGTRIRWEWRLILS